MMKRLIVGVDGSTDSLAALGWAAGTVGAGGTVQVVHAMSPVTELLIGAAQADPAPLRDDVEARLAGEWTAAARATDAVIECRLVEDQPADALMRIADDGDAEAIVVGPHGSSRLLPRRLGRTAARLLHESRRPVIIVNHGGCRPPLAGEAVVVGIGHDPASDAALHWAAAVAIGRRLPLTLVHALVHRPVFDENGLTDVLAYYIDPSKLREWAAEDLAELAGALRTSTDGRLPVSWTVSSGLPGPRLVSAAAGAALLVVGKNARGVLAAHVGATSLHHVLTHAPCPVAVIPVNTADASG